MSLHEVRRAVREDLQSLEAGDLVLSACSGGADSLALTSALLLEAPEFAIRVGVVTVDHQLQIDSDLRAKELIAAFHLSDVAPAEVLSVEVGSEGGPEAAARVARYGALDAAAARFNARAIYLAHSAGDQAESVLLGLARGSGTRSLSGMAAQVGIYRRPLLGLSREVVRAAGYENHLGITPWEDPHNSDSRFMRVRVRESLLPHFEAELGPGIEGALVRSARLLRADADALDAIADEMWSEAARLDEDRLEVTALAAQPRAIRSRVILRFLRSRGIADVTAEHVDRVDALLERWRGQGPVALPGGRHVARTDGHLVVS